MPNKDHHFAANISKKQNTIISNARRSQSPRYDESFSSDNADQGTAPAIQWLRQSTAERRQQGADENSPQRVILPPHARSPSASPIKNSQIVSNRDSPDRSRNGKGFGLHRPRTASTVPEAARPVIKIQHGTAAPSSSQGHLGQPVQKPIAVANSRRAAHPTAIFDAQRTKEGRPAASACANINITPRWTRDTEAKFMLRHVPPEWTTKAMHAEMLHFGNVTYIDLVPDQGPGVRVAFVTFSPPPDFTTIQRGLIVESQTTGRRHVIEFIHKALPSIAGARGSEGCKVSASRVDFGVMKSEDTMLGLHSVHATPYETLEVSLDTSHKRIELDFSVPVSMTLQRQATRGAPTQLIYKMRINLAQISSIIQMQDPNSGSASFVVTVDAPPLVYRKTDRPLMSHEEGSTRWSEKKLWFRQTEIEQDVIVAKRAARQLQRDNPIIDIGRWLTYRLTFDPSISNSKAFREFREALDTHSSSLTKSRTIKSQFAATKAMSMWSWLDSPMSAMHSGDGLSSLSDLQQMAHQTVQLPFEVRYQLESAISHGCLHECNIDQAFLEKLSAMAAGGEYGKTRAVKLLEKVVDEHQRFYNPMDIFRKVSPNMSGAFAHRAHSAHFIRVLTATVTPTTIYFNAPALEPSNRVIRHFRQYQTHFLRVRFADEKYKGKIYSSEEPQENEVFTRVKRTMSNGIKVGDRVYEFLAFGNSQFREHGAYFFAAVGDLNAAKIREWMGDFSHIKVVAKYCARVGQCLSTTQGTQNRAFKEVKIPDIERNGFCFTDGVGKISPMLAVLISSEIPGLLRSLAGINTGGGPAYPSAFQFRMGGCKGVLVVDPSMGSERSVAIRPSQEKFAMTKHAGLEICRISQFTNASLNVQIILVLSALGVPDKVFTDMLDAELYDIELAMTDEAKAIELLQKNIDLNQTTVQLAQMILDDFMERQDPFTISCLRLWRSWSLKYLKEKQRIFVEHGAFVLGCIDETATLEGHRDDDPAALPEIFLQIPDRERQGRYRVIEGVCMLARNPSLHPGDVRVVRAVPCDKLKHIQDCVVLPQKGDRDVANMCAGGDLDGDDYMIIWDEQLLPKEWNHPAMDYQAPTPIQAEGKITVDDMTSFFVTHMKYDTVGRIATLHKCLADREPEGVKSAKCIRLAELHSRAVDYAKTGVPASLPKDLQMSKRPHWHEKAKNTYKSNRVIGQLYDKVKRVDFVPAWDLPFDARILEAYELNDDILAQAREVKDQYDEAVRRVMAKFDIKSEFEVWSTFALGHGDDYNDYKFAEKIGEEVLTLKERFQKLCHERIAEDEKTQRDWSKKGPFVAAMYTVTAREVEAALAECEQVKVVGGEEVPAREMSVHTMPFISFPWLFPPELGWIANKRSGYAQGLTVLARDVAKQVQQAAKAKRRQEMMGDVAQPAPLQELLLKDSGLSEDAESDEQDLIDIKYVGPRLRNSLGPATDLSQKKRETATRAQTASDMDVEAIEAEGAAATPPSPMLLPALTDRRNASDVSHLELLAAAPSSVTTSSDQPVAESSSTAQDEARADTPTPQATAAKSDEEDEGEAEEVVLAPAGKSAFDALEELLGS